MVESYQGFPHIRLRLTTEGRAASPPGGGKKNPNPITVVNLGNRQGHGGKLKGSVDSLIFEWQETQKEREQEGKPPVKSRRIILEIDPDSFNPDGLKAYGIELIADTEDGYIIGASADLELSELQKKIEKFINEQYGGKTVAQIWEIIDGKKKPELILSPNLFTELYDNWLPIKEQQIYTVDVGIACVGNKIKLPSYPKVQPNDSNDSFTKKVNNWIQKRELTEEEWEEISWERQDEFEELIKFYKGSIIKGFQDDGGEIGTVRLPDSFSCRVQISGKSLKDLVENFPYIFEISEPDQFAEMLNQEELPDSNTSNFKLDPPESNAPKVCIIDSGIQEMHSLLKVAIDLQNSTSWVPGETGKTPDYVKNGGHGTRVAGALLYPKRIPRSGNEKAICWVQNARVLDADCYLPVQVFPPQLLQEIVEFYHDLKLTRIFNHSITGQAPCLTRYMSAWASTIDNLIWQKDILVIVAAGNLPRVTYPNKPVTRLSIRDHLSANRLYPDYLLEDSCRIANPAQSFQALTVGSIASNSYNLPPYSSIAQKDQPSAFSCSGLGIWNTIKPEVVEYGGDLVKDEGTPPNITSLKDVCPELVRSTLYGGPAVAADNIGTSFAAPKVTYIAARLAAELPNESCLLYRALIVQSARWPEWAMADKVNKLHVLRQIGYGLPNADCALSNSPNRITLITTGERRIVAKQAHVYQVKLPEQLRSQGESLEILLEVTLSYKAQPRRTRRDRRKYLSTWLDWECSKKGEDPERFLKKILKEYDAPEDAEKGEGTFKWMLGKQNNHGIIKDVSRSAGTLQKDWAVVDSFQLTEAFSIAVVGHEGWNNDPEASVPYSLVVSFEAIQADIPIYTSIVEAQVETEIQPLIEIQSIVGG